MKRTIFFVFFASLVVLSISAQNWDINTLHKINSWDGKFIRNYNKIISRTEPYIAVGVPVAMALAAWVKKDRELLKDAVYAVSYTHLQGMKCHRGYLSFGMFQKRLLPLGLSGAILSV